MVSGYKPLKLVHNQITWTLKTPWRPFPPKLYTNFQDEELAIHMDMLSHTTELEMIPKSECTCGCSSAQVNINDGAKSTIEHSASIFYQCINSHNPGTNLGCIPESRMLSPYT